MRNQLRLSIHTPSGVAAAVSELVELQRMEYRIQARRMELLARCEELTATKLDSAQTGAEQSLIVRGMHAEVGAALRISDTTVARHMTRAVAVVESYPQARRHCHAGELSFQQASIISDEGSIIYAADNREQYERAIIDYALHETAGRLRPVAKKLAAEHSDLDLTEQHQAARQRRHIRLHDHEDGMAELAAYLPAVEAYAIWDRITRMSWRVKAAENSARSSAESADARDSADAADNTDDADSADATTTEPDGATTTSSKAEVEVAGTKRALDEIRTDVLIDLLTAGLPSDELAGNGLGALTGRVQVTVPKRRLTRLAQKRSQKDAAGHAGTAQGRAKQTGTAKGQARQAGTDERQSRRANGTKGVAHLGGYGPIDIETAADLAGHATSWDEAHIDSHDGTVLTVESYQPSRAQRRFLRLRDIHCRFPGCRAPVERCEIDHTIDAAKGGATSTTNLAHLCKPHHRIKHHTDWKVKQRRGGVLEWTSPLGRTHIDTPVSRVMFRETDSKLTTKSQNAPPKKPSRVAEVLKRHGCRTKKKPHDSTDKSHPF